ncbi:MAG TPA: phytoene desaturase family protein [Cyclobacteriaceae bacterium]|nr:phytoene desaturase family protein [Cyclobacteriaceae bacterium]
MRRIALIGAGFAGLSAATCLAKEGYDVTIFEKNAAPGGRARQLTHGGFTFDMGPSFYWMPDVFEKYFALFGKNVYDYYELERLDPSYRVFFGPNDLIDVPAGEEGVARLFERLEPGSSRALREFLREGKLKYDIGINDLVYKPGLSLTEFANTNLLKNVLRLHVFTSVSSYVRKFFKNPRIVQLLEFPVLFLGAAPQDTPALYTLMNYADISLGTWYPKGGIYKVVEGMVLLAKELGVKFRFNAEISKLSVNKSRIDAIYVDKERLEFDDVVATADYHHVEQQLLPAESRRYTESYWDKRVMAPSALLFYIGVNKKLRNLRHHTLFFDEDFGLHANEIYKDPRWPQSPQFYVSCTSVSDPSTAPEGCENLVVLIPVAAGLNDEPHIREKYFNMIVDRFEKVTGESIRNNIVFKRSYAHRDFIDDYHALKGNAYGLANTLKQTANLRPSIVNKKVSNLFYAGQLTVPGPGVPPSLISGQVVSRLIANLNNK